MQKTLPRRKDDFAILPEADLLKPLVFGRDPFGKRRLEVAHAIAKAKATDHIQVCKHLGRVFGSDRTTRLLPRFARLADAGMAAMDLVAKPLRGESCAKIADIAALHEADAACRELIAAAGEWRKSSDMHLRHIETAHRFASAIPSAHQPIKCLRALLQHHEVYGGGLRWFVLRNDRVEPRTPPRVGSSRYRFRLWSLCRLATQCGVLREMPLSLQEDDDEGGTSEDE